MILFYINLCNYLEGKYYLISKVKIGIIYLTSYLKKNEISLFAYIPSTLLVN